MLTLLPGQVHVWMTRPTEVPRRSLVRYCRLLSHDELSRYHRYVFAKDREQFLIARGQLRLILSQYARVAPAQWQFQRTACGRPYIHNQDPELPLHFSVSHTRGLIVHAVSATRAIGIDVEDATRALDYRQLARRVCSPAETASMQGLPPPEAARRFLQLWTLKEAYSKATEIGLSLDVARITFSFPTTHIAARLDASPGDDAASWHFASTQPTAEHQLGLAIRARSDHDIIWIEGNRMDNLPEQRASTTAMGVATMRAAHQLIDHEPRILDDTIIVRLLGAEVVQRLERERERCHTSGARWLRAHVVLRSRFAEDRLAEAVNRGVKQYVILGSGFDTFPYRQPAWARRIRIFEVDQPASQRLKREKLAVAGITAPENLTFVEADFEHSSLAEMLTAAGFRASEQAFVSWLGVTIYLTEPAIDAVFKFVASLPAASEIVFTFHSRNTSEPELVAKVQAHLTSVGEPFRTWFDPATLDRKLRSFGYSKVWFLTPEEATQRYFPHDRSDGLPPPNGINTASAVV
jgi:methyltransferase (TIGR00027 family)